MSIKKTEKAATGNLNSKALTNEEEVRMFTGRIAQLELGFMDTQGATENQTRNNINEWLDEMELSFGEGMVQNNTMAGYGGQVITRNTAQLGFTFEQFREVYKNEIVRLSQVDLTQARLLRNTIGRSLSSDPEAVKELYDEYDDFVKKSFGKSGFQIKKEFVDKAIYRDLVFFIDSGGRRWSPSAYANMYARTRSREIEDIVMTDEMRELGFDVVRINDVSTITPICLQYENKYFSVFGQTPELPTLDILPPFHPNCRHRKFPVRDFKLSMLGVNSSIDSKVDRLSKDWSKSEIASIEKQEAWNLENRS
jgi:hypothetical protein